MGKKTSHSLQTEPFGVKMNFVRLSQPPLDIAQPLAGPLKSRLCALTKISNSHCKDVKCKM